MLNVDEMEILGNCIAKMAAIIRCARSNKYKVQAKKKDYESLDDAVYKFTLSAKKVKSDYLVNEDEGIEKIDKDWLEKVSPYFYKDSNNLSFNIRINEEEIAKKLFMYDGCDTEIQMFDEEIVIME